VSSPAADTPPAGVLVRSTKSALDMYDYPLSGAGGLASIAANALLSGHQPSGLRQHAWDAEQPQGFALALKAWSQGPLGPREGLPRRIEGFPPSGSIAYLPYLAGPPEVHSRHAHRARFLGDAEAWSSVLHTHSAELPAAFTTTWQGLHEHVRARDLNAMVKASSLLIAFGGLANPREKPVDTASDPNSKDLVAARRQLAQLAREIEQLDREHQLRQLEETAAIQARLRAPRELLDELAITRGLSWHTVARMIAVTPTAVRKWRRGGSLTPDNRQQLASLVAFFDLLEQVDNPPQDVGSWVEMPVREDTTLTPAAIYREPAGRWLLLDWVRDNLDTTSMLDRHDPDWRTRYAPDPAYRVGVGPDGEPAIVPR
jgi:hypothetical protein